MMLSNSFKIAAICFAALVPFAAAVLPANAADRTINAYAPIATTGHLLQTGTNHVSFVGVSTGMMIIETGEGLVNAGDVSCTVTLDMISDKLETSGNGRCSIVGTQGNQLYGHYSCTGKIGLGCKGPFTVDGGTGEFASGQGSGTFMIRSMVAEAAFSNSSAQTTRNADGIVLWQGLKIKASKTDASGN